MKFLKSKLNDKNKMRPLTKKEFILITILIFAIGTYSSFTYLIMPKWDKYKQITEELNTRKSQYVVLQSEFKNIKRYKDQLSDLKYQMSEIAKKLPPYIAEEDIILTIGKYAKAHEINIQSVVLDNENSYKANNFVNSIDKNGEAQQTQSQDTKDNNKSKEQKKKSNEEVGPTVLTKYITVSFYCKIDDLNSFVSDFEKNDKKIVVKEMSLNKDKDTTVNGNMKFQYIAYKEGRDISKFNLDMPKIKGKSLPFEGKAGSNTKTTNSEVDANFSLVLNKCDSQSPKFIFGENGKVETEIYNSTNDKITGKFMIEKEKSSENFVYTYSLGSNTKTEKKKLIIANGKLVLKVVSSPRDKKEDVMNITLDVENKTEYPLEVYVSNEDVENPRFILGNKKGNVYLKQVGK